jgi:Ser/Thr protein kinase RdoA (MazF antagonist)
MPEAFNQEILKVAQQYSSAVLDIKPLGNGYINDTYLVDADAYLFVLQKINKHVFPNPEQIMANLMVLNQHIKAMDTNQKTLIIPELLPAINGNNHYQDDQNDYWRALSYIENTESLETLGNLAEAEQVGFALGQFHRLTYGLDTASLFDTLPGFHIAPRYWEQYQHIKSHTSIAEDPYCGDFIDRFQHIIHDLETAKAHGLLINRVIHGDPKLNNFLFDNTSKRIVSLIDLDTVKPGLIHYDMGDCLRSSCHKTDTNEFDLDICSVILTTYLQEMGELFSDNDYQFLYPCIRLIPFELGIRFYADYLDGNRYFKVTEPKENLHRAIGQFQLCASVMAQEKVIVAMIDNLIAK